MYFPLTVAFLFLLDLSSPAYKQHASGVEIHHLTFQMSLTALIFNSSLIGGAIVAVLAFT